MRGGGCVDLTDVTLADEDTNSILADNAKRAIQGNALCGYPLVKFPVETFGPLLPFS